MSDEKLKKYSNYLSSLAEGLDIPPSTYQRAVTSYKAVGEWLNDGQYKGSLNGVAIHPQGSFEFGTVIKPLKGSKKPVMTLTWSASFPYRKAIRRPAISKLQSGSALKTMRLTKESWTMKANGAGRWNMPRVTRVLVFILMCCRPWRKVPILLDSYGHVPDTLN